MRRYNFSLSLISLCALLLSPFFGVADISFERVFEEGSMDSMLFWQVRAPRALLAFFAGAILALSGLIFQTLFRNALMTPFTLGVSSGATLGAAIAIYLGLGSSFFGLSAVSLFGFFGAGITVFLLFLLSSRIKTFGSLSLLLLGVALSHLYAAILLFIYYAGGVFETHAIVRFTLGSLSVGGYTESVIAAVCALLLLFASLFFAPDIRVLSVSEEGAALRGVNVRFVGGALLFAVSLSVGALTSITGPIGFVGLMIPHLLKKALKIESASLILPTFFAGGAFLLVCDLAARSFGLEGEIPIGVVTSAIGAPFFIYLILRNK